MIKQTYFDAFKLTFLGTVFILGLLYGCQKEDHPPKAQDESATVVYDWYKLQMRILLNANPATNNTLNINNFGYLGVALYEAVRPGIKGSVSLSTQLYQMPTMPAAEKNKQYLWGASANAALASMVRLLYVGLTDANKASIDSLENAYNQRYRVQTSSEVFERSQAFGRSISAAVYAWSRTDNFTISNAGYVPPVFPGAWEPTPPAFTNATTPFIKDARPFLASNQTPPVAPPLPFPYSEDPKSEFYKMVKEVYDATNNATEEQKTIARYWADVGVGIGVTPSAHIVNLVTQALESTQANLAKAAEVYAKAGIALRDGVITLWKIKYQHNLMRPVTYIRRFIDPNWLPLIGTPVHPEYPSAHAYLTSAVLQVLTREFGSNQPLTDYTYTFLGYAPRMYASFDAVVDEVAISRVYGGIHYKISIEVGKALGKQIGEKVASIKLTPK
jgi:hypothetical protein